MSKPDSFETPIADQVTASIVDGINVQREVLKDSLLDNRDKAFELCNETLQECRSQFQGPNFDGFLGSMKTKHGEVAEHMDVAITNAKDALNETVKDASEFRATFEGVGRTAPEDYLVDGLQVQSKYINGLNNNLKHVLDHMDKYDYFGRDGSSYTIPKDAFQSINTLKAGGEIEGINSKSASAILEKIRLIEEKSGQEFTEVVRPGQVDYADVQLNKADETMASHQGEAKAANESLKEKIIDDHQPSIDEALKAGLAGAAVGAAVSLTTDIYKNYKDGKNIFKGGYTEEDWKKLGLNTAKGGAIGGVSGAAIYGLTNYAGMAAPFAGAVVTAVKGMASLHSQYQSGEISKAEFMDLGMIVCAESAMVGTCTAIGQALIPIPLLGAVVGAVAGKLLIFAIKKFNPSLATKVKSELKKYKQQLSAAQQIMLDKINAEFDKLGDLTVAAFDRSNNERLIQASIALAQEYGIEESKIIHNRNELDDFMLG